MTVPNTQKEFNDYVSESIREIMVNASQMDGPGELGSPEFFETLDYFVAKVDAAGVPWTVSYTSGDQTIAVKVNDRVLQ